VCRPVLYRFDFWTKFAIPVQIDTTPVDVVKKRVMLTAADEGDEKKHKTGKPSGKPKEAHG
jgi:hypothetical protein